MKLIKGILFATVCVSAACTSDIDIKGDITAKAKTEISFAAVNYTVKNKTVTLSGTCPSEISKQKVLQAVKGIAVVNSVIDRIKIAPVLITYDMPMKQQVDSVLGQHPQVLGTVKNHEVTLYGYATRKEVEKIMPAVAKLHPEAVHNLITLQ
ncbi:BON domain-containing protein [Mucilaginibacter limnophilus]|uniref:BON domain-containing protein n=1 Tax=Mucilaginibacter limnophilus TaxID=1932778 RepID=A0A3S2VA34_9SPHI|nr:BON domain-containing protein [Mucilaginibacter limnophilus]RVU02479.1 BON domain-containing protein [Mucilaginibacter limnophilus]